MNLVVKVCMKGGVLLMKSSTKEKSNLYVAAGAYLISSFDLIFIRVFHSFILLPFFCLISSYLLNSSRNFASLVATEFEESFVAHRTFHLSHLFSFLFCQSRFLHARLL